MTCDDGARKERIDVLSALIMGHINLAIRLRLVTES